MTMQNDESRCSNKSDCSTKKNTETRTDTGAEEFSEQIYDENAPTPGQFDEPHKVSVTGATLSDSEQTG
jgi:hypothetical protein